MLRLTVATVALFIASLTFAVVASLLLASAAPVRAAAAPGGAQPADGPGACPALQGLAHRGCPALSPSPSGCPALAARAAAAGCPAFSAPRAERPHDGGAVRALDTHPAAVSGSPARS